MPQVLKWGGMWQPKELYNELVQKKRNYLKKNTYQELKNASRALAALLFWLGVVMVAVLVSLDTSVVVGGTAPT